MTQASRPLESNVHVRRTDDLAMFIAIDSLRLGPALGGCRWLPYPSEEAAREEAKALAAAMTRKAALADLPLGGGKAVVIGNPAERTTAQLHAFGDFVESLGGAYITAEDMGTTPSAMSLIAQRTSHVIGLPPEEGGCGDPSPHTAIGVFLAMKAALAHVGREIEGARISVQGVGAVGSALVRELVEAGAIVSAADPEPSRLAGLPEAVNRVAPERVLDEPCDVFAPCGPPGVLRLDNLDRLDTRVVCGAANNPLSEGAVAAELDRRGVFYVPDFLANAGGLIHLQVAREGGDAAATRERLETIPRNLREVIRKASQKGLDLLAAANEVIEDRLTR